MEEYLIRYRDREKCTAAVASLGGYVGKNFDFLHGMLVRLERPMLKELIRSGIVRDVVRNYSFNTSMNVANRVLGVDKLRAAGLTGNGVGIAFVDTGLFPHPDFLYPRNRIRAFRDFVDNKYSVYDDNGHGTFCAGVAAGSGYMSNGYFRGCAPGASIIAVKAMNKTGNGESGNVLRGIEWILSNAEKYRVRVVSLSIGTERTAPDADPILEGIAELVRNGITVVTAAGNDGPRRDTIGVPGSDPRVITVGAFDDKRGLAAEYFAIPDFSSRGGRMSGRKPDLLAPGVGIVSVRSETEYRGGRYDLKEPYTVMSGTSVAAPMVAGVCALMIQRWPTICPNEIKRMLMSSAVRISGDIYAEGRGRLRI